VSWQETSLKEAKKACLGKHSTPAFIARSGRDLINRIEVEVIKTNAPNPLFPFILDCNADQCLASSSTPSFASLFASYIGFISFDGSAQQIPTRSHHCSPQFVQPLPNCVVAAQVQNPLQLKGMNAVLLTSSMPHCSNPKDQWLRVR
jgi:hypothetical protein